MNSDTAIMHITILLFSLNTVSTVHTISNSSESGEIKADTGATSIAQPAKYQM